jgi:hypothetical protein
MNEVAFLVGQMVLEVRYGQSVRLVFELGDGPAPALYAALEEEFTYIDAAGHRHDASADHPAKLGPMLQVVGQTVTQATTESATLSLTFSDGSTIRCPPHPDYEAWEVVGGSPQSLVVCLPGDGDLAVFDERTPPASPEELEEFISRLMRPSD